MGGSALLSAPWNRIVNGAQRLDGEMIILIDNYDSFTYNLFHYLGELGAETAVAPQRRDRRRPGAMALARRRSSSRPVPAPRTRPGICLDLIVAAAETPTRRCSASASAIRRSARPSAAMSNARRELMHGKLGSSPPPARASSRPPSPFQATRYHSLIVERPASPTSRDHRRNRRRHDHGPASTARCRFTACSSTPRASPRSTATRSCRTSSRSPAPPEAPRAIA